MQCDAVDLLGDGKLLKKVLQEGHGDVPKVGDRVTVHYVCRLEDETVVDDSRSRGEPMCFALGQGDVIAGWESALPSMRCGELAMLIVHPDMSYGEAELAAVPMRSCLHFELELLHVLPAADAPSMFVKEDMSVEERLVEATKSKELGNARFKVGSFKDAICAYLDAIYFLGYEADCDQRAEDGLWSDPLRAEERKALALASQLNLCQSLLKLEDHEAALQHAEAAVALQPDNSKALYRRGLASMGCGHFTKAKSDLLAAAKKEPRSTEIRRSLEECQQRIANEKSATKDAYGGFLSRSD